MNQERFSLDIVEQPKVVKQIFIIADIGINKNTMLGYILYERNLSPTYKFTEMRHEEKDFTYLMDFPKQESFPNDHIDAAILQAIKSSYPKSMTRNTFIFWKMDLEKIDRLKDLSIEESQITFGPDISQEDISHLAGKSFIGLRKPCNVYSNYQREYITNLAFNGYYKLKDKAILDEIEAVKFH